MAVYHPHVYVDCEKCGQSIDIYHSCQNCDKIERLKGVTCPACKGEHIEEGGLWSHNGICGPGYSNLNLFPHVFCLDCGNIFYNVKKLKQ